MRNKKLYIFLIIYILLFFTFGSFEEYSSADTSTKHIHMGMGKREVLKILGAPDSVSKYPALSKEVWRYGYSNITFRHGKVYEFSGAKRLKIKIISDSSNINSLTPEFITINSSYNDVSTVLGTPDSVSKYPALSKEVWRYGYSNITYKQGKVYEYSGAKRLKIKILPKIIMEQNIKKPISTDFGSSFNDVLIVLGTPDSVSKYPALSKEVWRYGYSDITYRQGKVYEYSGGSRLKIAINPNGKYFDFDDLKTDYYYQGKNYNINIEENYYKAEVQPISQAEISIPIKSIDNLKNYKVQDYYKNSYSYVAENGSYYGQISKKTGSPKTVYVRGYFRKDGTYVRSHYRSKARKR
jgi:hypothetical protein